MTLSDPHVAAFAQANLVGTYAKKGTLTVYQHAVTRRIVKLGGNILSYVTTPDGRVLHAIPGSWDPVAYLQELKFAQELAELSPAEVQLRHAARAKAGEWNPAHAILAERPGALLEEIEERMFVEALGQAYAPDAALTVEVLGEADWLDRVGNVEFG